MMGFKLMQYRKKKETPKTVKSIYWYWRGSDLFGEGRGVPGWTDFRNEKRK